MSKVVYLQGVETRTEIIMGIGRILSHMTTTHYQVLPVRLDIRFPIFYECDGSNICIVRALRNFVEQCRRSGADVKYAVVREHTPNALNPHYHGLFLLDGRYINSPWSVKEMLQKHWTAVLGIGEHEGKGLIHLPINLVSSSLYMEMIYRPSTGSSKSYDLQVSEFTRRYDVVMERGLYLAKAHSKGNVPAGVREFLISHVKVA